MVVVVVVVVLQYGGGSRGFGCEQSNLFPLSRFTQPSKQDPARQQKSRWYIGRKQITEQTRQITHNNKKQDKTVDELKLYWEKTNNRTNKTNNTQ